MTCLLQIPNHVAIKIALELKKLLIDNSLLDVYAFFLSVFCFCFKFFYPDLVKSFTCMLVLCCSSQSDLEANLFKVCHTYNLTNSLHAGFMFSLRIFGFLILRTSS